MVTETFSKDCLLIFFKTNVFMLTFKLQLILFHACLKANHHADNIISYICISLDGKCLTDDVATFQTNI